MSIQVLIADDHTIVRSGLCASVQQEDDMIVVGEACEGQEAVESVRSLAPNVAIVDISMPVLNGVDATRLIRRNSPSTQVVALSVHSAKRYVQEMFAAGASAYLVKDCSFSELAEAIRTVAQGKKYVSPTVSDALMERNGGEARCASSDAFATLTPRERQTLQLIAEGHNTKQAAQQLGISPKTVEAHRLKVMQKLDIDSVAQLTKYAIQEGLTTAAL